MVYDTKDNLHNLYAINNDFLEYFSSYIKSNDVFFINHTVKLEMICFCLSEHLQKCGASGGAFYENDIAIATTAAAYECGKH